MMYKLTINPFKKPVFIKFSILLLILLNIISCGNDVKEFENKPIKNSQNSLKISDNNNNDLASRISPVLPIKNPLVILRMYGSNTIGSNLAPHMASEYLKNLGAKSVVKIDGEKENESSLQAYIPRLDKVMGIQIHAHGSSTAFEGFKQNNIDIGMSSRAIKDEEKMSLLVKHGDLTLAKNEVVIAMDGLSVITHPQNQLKKITTKQLAEIFSGKISNWSYFGLTDKPITVYARDDKSGTYDTFNSLVLKPFNFTLTTNAKRFESNNQLSEEVQQDSGAIGFTGMAYVNQNNVLNIGVSPEFDYIAPTNFSVNTEEYPLARRLYLYKSDKNNNPHINAFIQFVISKEGQKIVEDEQFISQKVYISSFNNVDFSHDYKQATKNLSRLSLNIRFNSNGGNFIFDSKSSRDLDRLAQFIQANRIQEILAIGFTGNKSNEKDPINQNKANINRSLRLANMVNHGLRERAIRSTKIAGLGTINPLESDETESGISKNSRVEIWIKNPTQLIESLN